MKDLILGSVMAIFFMAALIGAYNVGKDVGNNVSPDNGGYLVRCFPVEEVD